MRIAYLDHAKFYLTLLVVLHHTAITYGADGSWYYKDALVNASLDAGLLTLFAGINQSYFMGLFFFVSGIFAKRSLGRQGSFEFLKQKSIHLLIPYLLYVLLIHPFCIMILKSGFNLSFFIAEVQNFNLSHSGPLWFVGVLFCLFSLYLVADNLFKFSELPAKGYDTTRALYLILIIAITSFSFRQYFPDGVTVINVQLSYLPQYIILFFLGAYLSSTDWLETMANKIKLFWAVSSLVLLMVMVASLAAVKGDLSLFRGGLNRWCGIYSLVQAYHSVGFSIVFLFVTQYLNRRAWSLPHWITSNNYLMYFLHAPVLIGCSLVMSTWQARPLVKFLVVGAISCALVLVLSMLLRKLRLVRTVFG